MGRRPVESTNDREVQQVSRFSHFEIRVWKRIWEMTGEAKEGEDGEAHLARLQFILTFLGILGFKERHFPPGIWDPDDRRVRAFLLTGRCDASTLLLKSIHALTPMRAKLVFFGGIMGARSEDVVRLVGIKEEDLGMELEAGVADVKTELLEWHSLTWLGNGLDFCPGEFGLGKDHVPARRASMQLRLDPVAQDIDETYALILKGILRRLGGGPNLSRFVSQHLFRLPAGLQRILLLRHLSGFHPAVIGQHLGQSIEQVEQELLHGRQLLEEQLLESPTLKPFLAQMVAAMLVVSRDARGEGRAEREMGV